MFFLSCFINQETRQQINQATRQQINQATRQQINQATKALILVDESIDITG